MSRKIIGVTVGTTLPKPNFKQTDPTKGDYIKNKPDFEGLRADVDDIKTLVGDTAVSKQISNALAEFEGDQDIYVQNEEPTDAPDGSLWVDLDAEGTISGGSNGGSGACFVAQPEAPENTNVLWLDTDDDSESSGGNVENGEDGFSPIATVTQTEAGAIISITDKDGTTTATITSGKDGKDGSDYVLTTSDKAEIAEMVENTTIVAPPTYVDSLDKITDTGKVYVLAETGHIWAYMDTTTTEIIREDIVATSDNPYTENARLSGGTVAIGNDGYVTTPFIDITKYNTPFTLHLEGLPYCPPSEVYGTRFATYAPDGTFIQEQKNYPAWTGYANFFGAKTYTVNSSDNIVFEYDVPPHLDNNGKTVGGLRFSAQGVSANSVIYVTYEGTITGGQWVDTGTTYAPTLTEADKQEIADDVAALVDAQLLAMVGDGTVNV